MRILQNRFMFLFVLSTFLSAFLCTAQEKKKRYNIFGEDYNTEYIHCMEYFRTNLKKLPSTFDTLIIVENAFWFYFQKNNNSISYSSGVREIKNYGSFYDGKNRLEVFQLNKALVYINEENEVKKVKHFQSNNKRKYILYKRNTKTGALEALKCVNCNKIDRGYFERAKSIREPDAELRWIMRYSLIP